MPKKRLGGLKCVALSTKARVEVPADREGVVLLIREQIAKELAGCAQADCNSSARFHLPPMMRLPTMCTALPRGIPHHSWGSVAFRSRPQAHTNVQWRTNQRSVAFRTRAALAAVTSSVPPFMRYLRRTSVIITSLMLLHE